MASASTSGPRTMAVAPRPGDGIWRSSALLLLGHGSATVQGASNSLQQMAGILAQRQLFAEIATGFLAGEPEMAATLAQVAAARVYLLPCFISAGYFSQTRIPATLGLAGAVTVRQVGGSRQVLCYCEPLGEHPALADIAEAMARRQAVTSGIEPAKASLLLVAHGNARHPASAEGAARHAARIAGRGQFARVALGYLEQAPLLPEALGALPGDVLVVGLFAAEGRHGGADLVQAVAAEMTRRGGSAGRVLYCGAVGSDPAMADLVLAQVRNFDARYRRA